MTGLDVPQALERELAGHPVFGDTRAILHRARSFALMQLEALSRGRPLVRELCRELRKEGNRRAAADILDDPVVLRSSEDLLEAIRCGERSTPDETEEVFAAVLRHLRHGPPGLPVAAGCPHHFRSRRLGPSITVWDPDVPDTVVKRRFASIVEDGFSDLPRESRSRRLQRPEPAFVDALRRSCDLLALLLPELSASVLDHVRLVGVPIGKPFASFSSRFMPSTIFLSGGAVDTPWGMAESLLHEALHQKMIDIAYARSMYRPDAFRDGAPTIRVIWRKAHGPLPIRRAWAAFHVYAHLAFFFARMERMEGSLADDFGTPPVSGGLGLERALGRAGHLGEELAAHAERTFDSDGWRFFAWTRRMLSSLCDADTLRAHVEQLRGDCGEPGSGRRSAPTGGVATGMPNHPSEPTHQCNAGECNGRLVHGGDAAGTVRGTDAGPGLPRVRKPVLVRHLGAVDAAELRAHVERLPERVWRQEDAAKENNFPCFAHTRHIVFRFTSGNRTPLRFYSTPIWAAWQRLLLPVMAQAAAPYGYTRPVFPKVMLARLAAGGRIGRHRDDEASESHAFAHKIHVPLQTSSRAMLTIGDTDFHLEAGHAWEVNNLAPHGAFNGGAYDRVHFIFEVFDGSRAASS